MPPKRKAAQQSVEDDDVWQSAADVLVPLAAVSASAAAAAPKRGRGVRSPAARAPAIARPGKGCTQVLITHFQ